MARVAVVAPRQRVRAVLVEVADAGVMQIDERTAAVGPRPHVPRGAPPDVAPRLAAEEADVDELAARGRWDLVAGEVELAARRGEVVEHGPAVVLLGWVPADELGMLAARIARFGASVAELPRPRSAEPPTALPDKGMARPLRPLVTTYSVIPYEDVDPSVFATVTYVLMFGVMFGDVGHGLVLAALGVLLARTSQPRFARLRHLWPFPVAAGLIAAVVGLLYGECFGPTGLVPTLWFSPLDDPVRLLVVAIGLGAVLLGASYVIGTVNRWREGGLQRAVYSANGLAGVAIFAGGAVLAAGVLRSSDLLVRTGAVLAGLGLVLTFVGSLAEAGRGGAAVGQAVVEVFDTLVRIVANVVSFGRLAAFGLTHAAIGAVVWQGTQALWGLGSTAVLAALVFVLGNVLAFALEGLVAGVQALRLEYYELFSRIFTGQGRPFRPWHVPMVTEGET